LVVYNPDREIYLNASIPVNSDRSFSYSFFIEDQLGISGSYEYSVFYHPLVAVGSTFVYIAGPYQLEYGGMTYPISYRLYGEIESISLDVESKRLLIVTDGGAYELEIELPRALIDSKEEDGADSEFTVLVGGNRADVEELRSENESRTILIEICKRNINCEESEVAIVGTRVVPEFSSLAGIIGVLSIGAIVIAFRWIGLHLRKC
ncbi:MAG: hypothetical protein ACREBU_20490, partial [Nitrososphaera sp.]